MTNNNMFFIANWKMYGNTGDIIKCSPVIKLANTKKYKKHKIENNEEERVKRIESLNFAGNVVIVDNNDHKFFFDKYNVTHLFHGTDWEKESYFDFMGREDIESRSIKVFMLPHTKGISSTILRNLQIERKTINETEEAII